MRGAATLSCLWLLSGCAGLLHAPAEGRPDGQVADVALLQGMNAHFLGPHLRRVQVEVDSIAGWEPGETALRAMRAELERWLPPKTEIVVRVDPAIPLDDWRRAEDSLGHVAALVRDNADGPAGPDVTQLHVVYVPGLRPLGLAGALGVTLWLPHGSTAKDMRMSVLLGTDPIRKIAALWIGPRKVERTVLVHELGHVFGLVADGAHQHRGDPSHCRNTSCLMVSSGNRNARLVGAPRAIFLGRLPTSYCKVCRGDLEAARALFASSAQDPTAWAELERGSEKLRRRQWIAFLLESGEAEAAVAELQGLGDAATFGELWSLSRTLRGLGRPEEALETGKGLLPLDEQGRSVVLRAGPLLDMARWDEALQEIENGKASGTIDRSLEIRALLGAGRVEEADELLRASAQVPGQKEVMHYILRERLWLWRTAGHLPRALEILATVPRRELRGSDELALEAGRLLLAVARTEDAHDLLRPIARKTKPKHRGDVGTIVRARALTGDAEGALRGIARSGGWIYPGEQSLLRGEILAALGRTDEALSALEEARRQGASPEVPCLDPDLASLRTEARFQSLYRCAGPAHSEIEKLAARVALAHQPGSVVVAGARLGNELLTSPMLPDPEGPETLDVNFDAWVAAARAHLLLDYARATLAAEHAPDYAGWPEMLVPDQRSRDAANRLRISRIAAEGDYLEAWAPFVEAYRGFRADALEAIPEGDPSLERILQVDQIAQKHGLHRQVADVRIESRHVATEMIRLVRERQQSTPGAQDKLFYACDGEVRFRVDHPLGPALAEALTDGAHEPIAAAFRQLQATFAGWWRDHPNADQSEQDAYLRGASDDVGLLGLLGKLGP